MRGIKRQKHSKGVVVIGDEEITAVQGYGQNWMRIVQLLVGTSSMVKREGYCACKTILGVSLDNCELGESWGTLRKSGGSGR